MFELWDRRKAVTFQNRMINVLNFFYPGCHVKCQIIETVSRTRTGNYALMLCRLRSAHSDGLPTNPTECKSLKRKINKVFSLKFENGHHHSPPFSVYSFKASRLTTSWNSLASKLRWIRMKLPLWLQNITKKQIAFEEDLCINCTCQSVLLLQFMVRNYPNPLVCLFVYTVLLKPHPSS